MVCYTVLELTMNRIPWNKYETAILIEASLQVIENKKKKREVISSASKALRQMAINQGFQIDDLYRNTNGISMQMTIMISVIEDKESPLHSSPKIFNEVANLYKNDKSSFDKILQEAKAISSLPILDESDKITIGGNDMKENEETTDNQLNHTSNTKQHDSDIEKMKNDFANWMQNQGSAQGTIQMYVSAIRQASRYAIEYEICSENLFLIMDSNVLQQIFNELSYVSEFRELNIQQHNRFSAAIAKLINYRSDSSIDSGIHAHKSKNSLSVDRYKNIDFTQYQGILKSKFPRGFRLNDSLDIKKFRRYWNELYNEENNLSNEIIWDYISHITIAHGKISYLPEMMIDEKTKTKLFSYIDKTFASGKKAIYYEALYQMFRDDLDNGRINNSEMLKTYLEYINKGKYFLQKAYIAVDSSAKVDPTEEVRSFLKSHELPMLTEDIINALPHLDKYKITNALSGNNSYEFVRNQKGEYFHADIIEFTDIEISKIEQLISESISQNEYISGKELTSLVDRCLPEIHERYTFLTELGLRDTIAYKLRGKFSFKSKIISKYGEDLNMDKVFSNFGKNHAPFTMEQLIALKDELGTTIYFESLYHHAMRINQNEFVSRKYADFDISATDDAIEQFCTGNFISIQDVTLFGGFPSCGYAWNNYLLEYYVMYFSRKFKLLHTNFNMNSSVGAIVKKNVGIETFDDVIIRALAQSNIALNTDDALNYLCESGFLARRSYGTIDNIVSQAKAYRALKGE